MVGGSNPSGPTRKLCHSAEAEGALGHVLRLWSGHADPQDFPRVIETWRVVIPANLTCVWIKIDPRFDWLDEGLRGSQADVPAAGDPGDYSEVVNAKFNDACWANIGDWEPAGAPDNARLVIHDGAILRIRTDSNNDGEIDDADDHLVVKNSPDTPGRVVLINSDDDDQSGMADKWERPEFFHQADNSYAYFIAVCRPNGR